MQKEFSINHIVSSVFISYKKDIKNTEYEVYKVIQSKSLRLRKYQQHFKWSLPETPKVSSLLQECNNKSIKKGESGDYDKVDLILKKPLGFNEVATIHFKAEMNDPNNESKPYVEFRINQPIRYLDFRVCLLTMPDIYNKNAKAIKRPISAGNDMHQAVIINEEIPFIKETKTYHYFFTDPEAHCFYRLEWEWP